ncbi:MAG TPA: DNA double-strand break repair nuclease NurA [Candidatus Bathyarchaeota archaeon]|nr:DNA double-strand break repair nuclease NurA [Candidatus Bathyarchaeota archaeon]
MEPRKEERFRRIPQPFREEFLQPLTVHDHETIHPDLYRHLIDEGTDIIIEGLRRYNENRKRIISRVREKIDIRSVEKNETFSSLRVVASDAGNNGVDLRSAFIPLYASVALTAEGWRIPDEPIFIAGKPELWTDEFKAGDREALLAFKIQAEVTIRAVEKWSPKFVFFDGPLLLSSWIRPVRDSSPGYIKDFNETLDSIISLIHACYVRDVPIIGFAKRVRAVSLCRSLGVEGMRDTALLDLVLKMGEYTVPNKLTGGLLGEYEKSAKRLGISTQEIREILIFYSSYIRTGFRTPYRLELPCYCIDRLSDAAVILYTTSEEDGIPFSINEADRMVRVTTGISNIRTLMIYSKALELVNAGKMDPEDLNMLTLQHGEPWSLRDEDYIEFKEVG